MACTFDAALGLPAGKNPPDKIRLSGTAPGCAGADIILSVQCGGGNLLPAGQVPVDLNGNWAADVNNVGNCPLGSLVTVSISWSGTAQLATLLR